LKKIDEKRKSEANQKGEINLRLPDKLSHLSSKAPCSNNLGKVQYKSEGQDLSGMMTPGIFFVSHYEF